MEQFNTFYEIIKNNPILSTLFATIFFAGIVRITNILKELSKNIATKVSQQLKILFEQLTNLDKINKLDRLTESYGSIEKINEKLSLFQEASEKYGNDYLKRLILYNDYNNYLKNYSESTFEVIKCTEGIYNIPNDIVDYWKKKKQKHESEITGPVPTFEENIPNKLKLRINHILFKVMVTHQIMISKLVRYKDSSQKQDIEINQYTPIDLYSSYSISIKLAENVSDEEGSLLWFTNMKNAQTYAESKSVTFHYKKLNKIIASKKSVDVRRIHIFYGKNILQEHEIYINNVKSLFTTLLIEYLHGIQSRVVIIKKDHPNNSFCDSSNGNKYFWHIRDIFLLDYAIIFSKNSNDKDVKDRSYALGQRNVLCADFPAEMPEIVDVDQYEQEDKVHNIEDPLTFEMFKLHFLSLWNFKKYIRYLKYTKTNPIDYEYLKNRKNITVVGFFGFWSFIENCFLSESGEKLLDSQLLYSRLVANQTLNEKLGINDEKEYVDKLKKKIDFGFKPPEQEKGIIKFSKKFRENVKDFIVR